MSTRERRRHQRLPLPAPLKVMHESFGAMLTHARDMSDSGLFIKNGEHPYPPVGSLIQVQAAETPVEAEILNARIVRVTPDGVGVEFCEQDD